MTEVDNSLAIFATAQLATGQPGILNCASAQSCSGNNGSNPASAGATIVLFANGGRIWNNTPQYGPGNLHVDGLDGSIALLAQRFQQGQASLTIGGQPAVIEYAGAAPYQIWGNLQINAVVPTGLASQQATIYVQ